MPPRPNDSPATGRSDPRNPRSSNHDNSRTSSPNSATRALQGNQNRPSNDAYPRNSSPGPATRITQQSSSLQAGSYYPSSSSPPKTSTGGIEIDRTRAKAPFQPPPSSSGSPDPVIQYYLKKIQELEGQVSNLEKAVDALKKSNQDDIDGCYDLLELAIPIRCQFNPTGVRTETRTLESQYKQLKQTHKRRRQERLALSK